MGAPDEGFGIVSMAPTLPTCEETAKHPAYSGAVWNLEPHRGGTLPTAARNLRRPVKVTWEIHGYGPIKVVVSGHVQSPLHHSISSSSFRIIIPTCPKT
jgi:hypothetical protein